MRSPVGVVLRRFCAVIAFALAPLAASAAQDNPAPEPPRAEDGYFAEVRHLAPGVWIFMQPRFQIQPAGNVTVVEQADGLVLVDTGGSPGAARRIIREIRKISDKPVKAVVITHWHGDHPQGLSEVIAAWPQARTIATRATQAHLRDPKTMNTPAVLDPAADAAFQARGRDFAAYARRRAEHAVTPQEMAGWARAERLFGQYARDMAGAVTLSTREAFDDALDLPDEDAPAEVRFLGRANTDGDAIVWLPRQKVLITGDVVVAPFPFGFGSYPGEWISALDRVRAYDFHVLAPGHGAPQTDRAYLDRLASALADVRAQVTPLAAQGLSLEEVRRRTDFSGQLEDFGGEDPWLRRWVAEYWITPIVASAYKEATGRPIIQSLRGE